MSDRVGVVYDLGYAPYEGERRGRRGAFVTTVRDGVARVFGIRRGARKKVSFRVDRIRLEQRH